MDSFQFSQLQNAISGQTHLLQQIATSLAQLVSQQNLSSISVEKHMTIDDALFAQILAAWKTCLTAETGNQAAQTAALAAKDTLIATLTAQVAPNQVLIDQANQLLTDSLAANPPAPPAPVTA